MADWQVHTLVQGTGYRVHTGRGLPARVGVLPLMSSLMGSWVG